MTEETPDQQGPGKRPNAKHPLVLMHLLHNANLHDMHIHGLDVAVRQ